MRLVQMDLYGKPYKYHWEIWERRTKVGELTYTVSGRFVILGYLYICPAHRKKQFGYKTVEYLLKRYPTKSIVGETLSTSKGFWRKCIKKYNGVRKNVSYCDNCSSSFIIPKRDITFDKLKKCLETAYQID